jgi:hypothetical protein
MRNRVRKEWMVIAYFRHFARINLEGRRKTQNVSSDSRSPFGVGTRYHSYASHTLGLQSHFQLKKTVLPWVIHWSPPGHWLISSGALTGLSRDIDWSPLGHWLFSSWSLTCLLWVIDWSHLGHWLVSPGTLTGLAWDTDCSPLGHWLVPPGSLTGLPWDIDWSPLGHWLFSSGSLTCLLWVIDWSILGHWLVSPGTLPWVIDWSPLSLTGLPWVINWRHWCQTYEAHSLRGRELWALRLKYEVDSIPM